MPDVPVPESTNVAGFVVPNNGRSAARSSSIATKSRGSRWPSVGADSARSTDGATSDGPGPSRVRTGGWKGCIIA